LKEERSNIDSNQNLNKKYLKAVYLMLWLRLQIWLI
jgi:hypothetical protein